MDWNLQFCKIWGERGFFLSSDKVVGSQRFYITPMLCVFEVQTIDICSKQDKVVDQLELLNSTQRHPTLLSKC